MKLSPNAKLKSTDEGAMLFGLVRILSRRKGYAIQFNPIKLLIVLTVVTVVGYIVAVSVAYSIRSKRPHNQIAFTDFALPWNWPDLSEKAGQTNIAYGKALFEEQEYFDAMYMLRAGLKRYPNDQDARFKLAQIYSAAGKSIDATNILSAGLEYGYPENKEYVQALMLILTHRQDFAEFADVTKKLRSFPEVQEDEETWDKLVDLELKAMQKEGDYEQILEFAQEMLAKNPGSVKYEDLETLALIKMGFMEEARDRIDSLPMARKHTVHFPYLLGMLALETGDYEGLKPYLQSISRWPTKPYPLQVQMIRELDLADLVDERDTMTNVYIEQYANNPAALELLLAHFIKSFSIERTDKILTLIAAADPAKAKGMTMFAIEARLYNGQPESARQIYNTWTKDEMVAERIEEFQWLDTLITVLTEQSQNERKSLWDLTRTKRHALGSYYVITRSLLGAGDYETALRVSENGLHYFPHDSELAENREEASARQ
ncbi:MAG: tetratricopeptide repeat protein [Verrucomicrobiota bacterium]